uniref:WGS project CBMG000000000 data, contig CS5907-c000341 n=1 Tax=Fusarium acuminatum CS5907 TaxID=1318461 RepID=A0A096PDU5_9HYPO|nr:unnamed protein product [Fusarium acuminatum CS5907]
MAGKNQLERCLETFGVSRRCVACHAGGHACVPVRRGVAPLARRVLDLCVQLETASLDDVGPLQSELGRACRALKTTWALLEEEARSGEWRCYSAEDAARLLPWMERLPRW